MGEVELTAWERFAALSAQARAVEQRRAELQRRLGGSADQELAIELEGIQRVLRMLISNRAALLPLARREVVASVHGTLWLAQLRWPGMAGAWLKVSGGEDDRRAEISGVLYDGRRRDLADVPGPLAAQLAACADESTAQVLWMTFKAAVELELTPYGVRRA